MYTTTISNELGSAQCARCGSYEVAHQYETTIRKSSFILIAFLRQSVKLKIPLCEECKGLCDRRASFMLKLMMWLFLGLVVSSIVLFITRDSSEAFWLSVLAFFGFIFVCAMLGHFMEPRLVRFRGTSIKPLWRR